MLVLHPSSRCDICLDDYTWVTPANSPHAISCGHIFCLTCLRTLQPSACPLCRKFFQSDRVKKLHVDKAPDEPDGTNVLLDSHAAVLLQRVALISGDNAPDADVAEVIQDVMEWLSTQSDDLSSNRPLQSAVKALRKHRIARDKLVEKRAACIDLEKHLSSLEDRAEQDRKTAKAIEESLLARLADVESGYTEKLQAAETQVASLQYELSRYKNIRNPLPPPPQPLPLDQFPSLAQHFNAGTATNGHSHQHATNGHGHRQDLDHSHKHGTNGAPYVTTTPFVTNGNVLHTPRPRTTSYPDYPPMHLTSGSAHTHAVFIPSSLPVVGHSEPSRSGKRSRKVPVNEHGQLDGRAPSNGAAAGPSRGPTSQPSQPQPQNKYPYIESELLMGRSSSARVAESSSNDNRARIIPGASPTHRIIPPRVPPLPKFLRRDLRLDNPENMEAFEKSEDGKKRLNRDENSSRRRSFRDMDELALRHRGQSRGMAMANWSDGEDDVEGRLISASAFVSGYGSGYNEGYGYASAYSGEYMPPRRDGYAARRQVPVASEEESVSGLGLLGVPGDAVVTGTVTQARSEDLEDVTTPRPRHADAHRRLTPNNSYEWASMDLLVAPPSSETREGSHRTLEQVLRSDTEVVPRTRPRDPNVGEARPAIEARTSMNSMNSSASSWGTVDTGSRGSMSDLGLIGLHRVAGGLQSTPMFGRDIESDTERGNGSGTPRVSWVMHPPPGFQESPVEERTGRPQSYSSDNERPRHLRSQSHPEVPLTADASRDPQNSRHGAQAIRPHSRRHSLTQSVSLDSGTPPPSIYRSQPAVNALALTFDTAAPFVVDTRRATNEQIHAPAPRVGGPNVLNLWESDD